MGLLTALKDRVLHKGMDNINMDTTEAETVRSRVLGEPAPGGIEEEAYTPESKYAPPALTRMKTTRTHNIGPPEPPAEGVETPMPAPALVGRHAEDIMPAERAEVPAMFTPAPGPLPTAVGEPAKEEPLAIPPANSASNDALMEKIEFLRQEIKSVKNDIELLNERIKNVQQKLESRRY